MGAIRVLTQQNPEKRKILSKEACPKLQFLGKLP
jgi:hypothetical protein